MTPPTCCTSRREFPSWAEAYAFALTVRTGNRRYVARDGSVWVVSWAYYLLVCD